MALDTSTLPPKTRTKYLSLGRQYGSSDTLNQANQTLNALAEHGLDLARHGFAFPELKRDPGPVGERLAASSAGPADLATWAELVRTEILPEDDDEDI